MLVIVSTCPVWQIAKQLARDFYRRGIDNCDHRNHTGTVPNGLSPAHLLADQLLDRPLADYVVEKRAAVPQWSWRLIAETLAQDTEGQVDVHSETLRLWFQNVAA